MTSDAVKPGFFRRLAAACPFPSRRTPSEIPRHPDVPLTTPALPLREAVVALVTTGGVHTSTQPPFEVDAPQGDASYRSIPVDTPAEEFRITHDYYDHSDADNDLNLVLPIQRLQEFKRAGALGMLHGTAYSLMGHVAQERMGEVREGSAAEIAGSLSAAGVHYALLIPAGGCCNLTIGVLARSIENAGIATVALSNSLELTAVLPPPRALYLRFPFGHALGEPGNRNQQCAVLHQAFRLLFDAELPATVVESGLRWRRERYLAPDWDEIRKLEPLQRS